MLVLILILVAFGLLVYFNVFKKDKQQTNSGGGQSNQEFCKKYAIRIIDESKVENLAWIDCGDRTQGGVAKQNQEFCAKSIIYHNPTNLELLDRGYCS